MSDIRRSISERAAMQGRLHYFTGEELMATPNNQSSESMSTARDRAQHVAGQVVDKVQEAASRLAGGSSEPSTSAGGAGAESSPPISEQAAEQVTSRLDMGKEYVAGTLTGVAQALRQTGQHLREEGSQPTLAQFADRGAEQIEDVGGYLRRTETGQLVSDLEAFARRQPMVFAGGAFALGMLTARFFRSGSPPRGQTPPVTGSSYGGVPSGTSTMAGEAGGGMTAAGAWSPPGGQAPSAPAVPSSTPNARSTPSSTGAVTGTSTAPGARTTSEPPTPRPMPVPPMSGTSTGSGTTAPRSEPGTQAGGSSTSGRTGTGGRTQP